MSDRESDSNLNEEEERFTEASQGDLTPTPEKPNPTGTIPKLKLNDKPEFTLPLPLPKDAHIKTRYSVAGNQPQSTLLTPAQEINLMQLQHKYDSMGDTYRELMKATRAIEQLTMAELDGHQRVVDAEWRDFQEIQNQIIDYIPTDHEYITERVWEKASTAKKTCTMLISRLRGELEKINKEKEQSSESESPRYLQRLGLKTFDGKPTEWREFSNIFQSLVGKSSKIPPEQKLVRLKSCLRGQAGQLLSNFDVDGKNYEKAWQKLCRKYEDPRLIAQALINKVLELPKINNATEENLTNNIATVVEALDELKEVKGIKKEDIGTQVFLHLLRKSLDSETLRQWELKLGDSRDFPSLDEFTTFIEACARGINAGKDFRKQPTQQTIKNPQPTQRKKSSYSTVTQRQDGEQPEAPHPQKCCAFCENEHFIDRCQKFLDLSPVKRNDVVMVKGLCFRCLGPHKKTRCKSTKTCLKCGNPHHTLIHNGHVYSSSPPSQRANKKDNTAPRPSTSSELPSEGEGIRTSTSVEVHFNQQQVDEEPQQVEQQLEADQQAVLLATANLRVQSTKGFSIKARALIDQGSEISFISEKLVQQLHLSRRQSTLELIGIGGVNSGHTRGIVSATLQPINGQQQIEINAHILKKLTAVLPSFSCTSVEIGSLENLQLADPQYLKPGPIDIIIGADNYGRIIKNEVVKSTHSQVVGQRTAFGWILSGPVKCTSCSRKISLSAVRESSNEQLQELLQRFWVQEELSTQQKTELSTEENECEQHFVATHSRDSTGRYTVRLPLKISAEALGESRNKASRQLQSTIRKLNKNEAYSQLYKEFIREYETLGHMRRTSTDPEPSPVYYLPHHGVLREDAITTKLRVVFNGSSPTSSGLSLNDILYPGGKLQIDAMNVLTWMRKHKYVFGTDIVKMFRQIQIHQDDWDLQRILWQDENQQEIPIQLTTVTYGLNCSPWLSLRVLQQLAEDEGHRYPAAVETLTQGRYVDDIYGGADSSENLKKIAIQLQGLCKAGGFELQKWSSNCPEILHQIGLSTEEEIIQFEKSVTKVLGLCWHQSSDTFRYKSRDFNSAIITKRVVSSEIAQIFDPLGFIAPVVIQGKILLQELWKIKSNWDDQLPGELKERWKIFREHLHDLDRVAVPRWLRLSTDTSTIQIHGFSDASETAMSAVVYIRTQNLNQVASTVLVCAKTKVAPIKRLTIPRLELTAAFLLTNLVAVTQQILQLDQVETYLWSDSSVTLAWIRSHASRWKEFVHNRVVKIQETLPSATWRHVSGKENPADCASRGISPSQLAEHPLWWAGPEWLNQDPEDWPQSTIDTPLMENQEIAKEARPSTAHPTVFQINQISQLLNRYSTMARLLAVTATISRALDRFKRRPTPPGPVLTTRELNEARIFWAKLTQGQYFGPAIGELQRNHQLPRSHQLASLTPILDQQGIMRIGGRLKNSQLDPDEIQPIILPRKSKFTKYF